MDRSPLSQTALSTIHLMFIAASLPTPVQGQGCPCQPPATHALFGISINESTLGSSGSDHSGLQGKHHRCGCGGGMQGLLPSGLLSSPGSWWKRSPAPSSLEMSMSMHVGKEAGSQHFGFTRTRHPELEGLHWAANPASPPHPGQDSQQLAVWPMAEQPRFLWLFLHLVQTHHHPVLCK